MWSVVVLMFIFVLVVINVGFRMKKIILNVLGVFKLSGKVVMLFWFVCLVKCRVIMKNRRLLIRMLIVVLGIM